MNTARVYLAAPVAWAGLGLALVAGGLILAARWIAPK